MSGRSGSISRVKCGYAGRCGQFGHQFFSRKASAARPPLDFPPAFHGFPHGDFVGKLEIAAYGNSHSDARDFDAEGLQKLRQVDGRGFAFDVGLVAAITSSTPPRAMRSIRLLILSCSGPMPRNGESAPPST